MSTEQGEQGSDFRANAKRSLDGVRQRLLDVAGRLGELRQRLSDLAADGDRQAPHDRPGSSSPA